MALRFCLRGAGLALLIGVAPFPAQAESGRIVLSEQQLAVAIRRVSVTDEVCDVGPYALYRQTCVSSELNISPDRESYQQVTMLDRVALFVYRYKDLNLRQDITPGARILFRASLSNIYQQEAYVELRMRVRF